MCSLSAAGGTSDKIACANRIGCLADADFPAPLQHEKHLLLHMMMMERPRALARWHCGNVVPELLSADACTHRSTLRTKALGGAPARCEHRRRSMEGDIGDVHNRFTHECAPASVISPNIPVAVEYPQRPPLHHDLCAKSLLGNTAA